MRTQCPHCRSGFQAPDTAAGKKCTCPKCGKPFLIKKKIVKPPATWTCAGCGQTTSEPVQVYEEILCKQCAETAQEIEYLLGKKMGWHFICAFWGLGGVLCVVIGSLLKNDALQIFGILLIFGNLWPASKLKRLKNKIKKLEAK